MSDKKIIEVDGLKSDVFLLYRFIGYKTVYMKGFKNMKDLIAFVLNTDNILVIKRLRGCNS